jgi:hypothetical protein
MWLYAIPEKKLAMPAVFFWLDGENQFGYSKFLLWL